MCRVFPVHFRLTLDISRHDNERPNLARSKHYDEYKSGDIMLE